MAKSDSDSGKTAATASNLSTSGGFGGMNQDLLTGMQVDSDGNYVVPEINVPDGAEIVKTHQMGVYRRTVFSTGAVEIVQTKPAEPGDGVTIATPVPLPGEQQDVAGTGQDAATKPKLA